MGSGVADTFLDALAVDPTDPVTARIFADWLQEQSEPYLQLRGQIMLLQNELLQGVREPHRLVHFQNQLELLLSHHADAWQGPIRQHCQAFSLQRGLLHITLSCVDFLELQDQSAAWGSAQVYSLTLTGLEARFRQPLAEAPLLQQIPALQLTRLSLEDEDIDPLLRSRHLNKLRRLNLSNNRLGNATVNRIKMGELLPALRHLDLRNNEINELPNEWRHSIHLDLHGNRLTLPITEYSPSNVSRIPPVRVINSIGMELVLIPAGCFFMGSPESEMVSNHPDSDRHRESDERPRHPVTLTSPYYLAIYPVTQRQFEEIMEYNPSENGPERNGHLDQPVDSVSWEIANLFCQTLSARKAEQAAGRFYRLPTEAEWESACRAGTTSAFWWGNTAAAHQAQYDQHPYGDAPPIHTQPRPVRVGSFEPNPLGLYDMHGNIWEWCHDWYEDNTYREPERIDPRGPEVGNRKVCRGGGFDSPGVDCRSACRDYWYGTRDGLATVGFRVAMTLDSSAFQRPTTPSR